MTEYSLTDDDAANPPPAFKPLVETKDQLRRSSANQLRADDSCNTPPASVDSPTCTENYKKDRRPVRHYRNVTRDIPYGSAASAHIVEVRADNSPHTDETCSVPRSVPAELPQPPSMMELALQSMHQAFNAGFRSSLGTMAPKITLWRCWGALKETLDELGNVWDGDAGSTEHNEVVGSGADRKRSASAPVTPAKQSPREPITPQTQLLLGSVKSRPSHYDTIAHSPIADSRSSKRKRKPRLRYKSPTPVRRTHESNIDHSYSTEDEGSDSHCRLLNKFLFQAPSRLPQPDLYVFMYKQDSRTGSVDPDSENNKPNNNNNNNNRRQSTLLDVAEVSPVRDRTPVANAFEPPWERTARQSVANQVTGECQHGVLHNERACKLCDEIESEAAQFRLAPNCSTAFISQGDIDSRTRLMLGGSAATASSATRMPDDIRRSNRVPTPDNLRGDVKAIFFGHANSNKAVDRKGRPTEKLKFSERIKEALRPRHPDLLKYKPGPAKRSDAQPRTNSSFHMSDDGAVHRVVEHPPTRSSDPGRDDGSQLTRDATSEIPKVEDGVNDWLDSVQPQDELPDEDPSTDAGPPEPASPRLEPTSPEASTVETPAAEVVNSPKKGKRRPHIPESCTVLSTTIPPERNVTDLLIAPFITFQHELTSAPPLALPGDTLMSTSGVSYDNAAASQHHRLPVAALHKDSTDRKLRPECATTEKELMSAFGVYCVNVAPQYNVADSTSPADDAMSQLAAMGSLSTLSHIDSTVRQRKIEASRAKHGLANSENTAWLKLDDAQKAPCCWQPTVRVSREHCEYRAIRVYNLQNIFQGTVSRAPLLMIRQWMNMDECNCRMQHLLKSA